MATTPEQVTPGTLALPQTGAGAFLERRRGQSAQELHGARQVRSTTRIRRRRAGVVDGTTNAIRTLPTSVLFSLGWLRGLCRDGIEFGHVGIAKLGKLPTSVLANFDVAKSSEL